MKMKYFKMEEFRCKDGCNGLTGEIKANIEALVDHVLDPARERFGKAVYVNSGYRCERHNREVGGSVGSQHLRGEAADITAGSLEGNRELVRVLLGNGRFDQMILYVHQGSLAPAFIHVSWKRDGGNRHKVLKKVVGRSGFLLMTEREMEEVAGQARKEDSSHKNGNG